MRKLVEQRDLKYVPRLNRRFHIEYSWTMKNGYAINYLTRKERGFISRTIHLMKLTLKHWFK